MKKIRFIILIMFLFIITGCDGKYEIEIYKNKVNETVYTYYTNDELDGKSVEEKTLDIVSKYDDNGDFLTNDYKKNITNGDLKGTKSVRKFKSIDDYKHNSYILGSCYIATNLTNYSDYITIKTTEEFKCMNQVEEFDNITIAVKTNHKVKEHNADKKKGNTYYWNINRDNYKNKPISIKMYKDKYVWNYNNEVFKRIGLIILIIGGTVLIVFLVNKWYISREKNSNKI